MFRALGCHGDHKVSLSSIFRRVELHSEGSHLPIPCKSVPRSGKSVVSKDILKVDRALLPGQTDLIWGVWPLLFHNLGLEGQILLYIYVL